MAKHGNRVKETTDTTGTGTLDLSGAPTGFRSFSDEFTNGDDKISYLIVDDPENPTAYEYGKGTFTSGTPDTLARDTVEGSSNSGNKVSFSAGTKTVIATPLASVFNLLDGSLGTNGQVLGSDGADAAWSDRQIIITPVDMSGLRETTVTGIPAWASTIVIGLASLVKAGTTDIPFLRLGDAGGVENSGYLGTVWDDASAQQGQFSSQIGLLPATFTGNNTIEGHITLERLNVAGTRWSVSFNLAFSNTARGMHGAGTKTLSAQLDRIYFALNGSTDDFTSGEITVKYS